MDICNDVNTDELETTKKRFKRTFLTRTVLIAAFCAFYIYEFCKTYLEIYNNNNNINKRFQIIND